MEFWLSNWETILGFGLTFASALVVWWRKVRPVIKHILELSKIQAEVYKQITPNGGSSVADKVGDILSQVGELQKQVTTISNQLAVEVSCRRFLFQRSPDAIYECARNGDCTWVNQALADLFGVSRTEALGRGWLKAVHIDDRLETWRLWQKSVELRVPYEATYRVEDGEGGYVRVRTAADACYDKEGQPMGFFGVVWPDEGERLDPYEMFGMKRLALDPEEDHSGGSETAADQE